MGFEPRGHPRHVAAAIVFNIQDARFAVGYLALFNNAQSGSSRRISLDRSQIRKKNISHLYISNFFLAFDRSVFDLKTLAPQQQAKSTEIAETFVTTEKSASGGAAQNSV
jgi:hypothetical protein